MDNTLSIIIPVMNDHDALSTLLPYLRKHSKKAEIWVIEAPDAQQSCQKLCEKFDVNFQFAPSSGRAIQMNYGASLATKDILLFNHADVLPPASFVNRIIEVLNSGYLMGFFAYEFSPSNKLLAFNASFTGKKNGMFTGGGDQCHFFTRESFDRLGGYDEAYVIMEDFALIKKAKKSKIPLSIVQDRAIVSSRKYLKNSYVRVNVINFIVFMAFHLGVKPQYLKSLYKKALN